MAVTLSPTDKNFLVLCLGGGLTTILALLFFPAPAPTLLEPWWLGLAAIGVVTLTQVLAAWVTLTPGAVRQRYAVVLWGLLSMCVVVLVRPAMTGVGWKQGIVFCSAMALLLPAVPLATGAWLLRQEKLDLWRGVTLGLASGASGATVLEVLCTRPRAHVFTFHIGGWVLVIAAAVLLEWVRLKRRTPGTT